MEKRRDLSRLSVLIVEDSTHMRAILRSILSGLGVRQIFEAAEATDGLEKTIDRQPDLVLCDWAMQPVSGGEFIQFLRGEKDATLSTTPVIVVSAHSRKANILEARKLGIHGFVAKPVSPAVLYQRICNMLAFQEAHGRTKGMFAATSWPTGGPVLDLTSPTLLGASGTRRAPGAGTADAEDEPERGVAWC
ncbi:response regulator [Roseibium aestuarii]|uniref:Response regulator n=1 Tax=Roseibium aestuarii TaxID=2600299 RepID=A0ABW4JT04_9HYPH|nr:response regulator [Roseibium aestuarii]